MSKLNKDKRIINFKNDKKNLDIRSIQSGQFRCPRPIGPKRMDKLVGNK